MPATPVMMSEDRRSLTVRLSSLQYIIAVLFAALAVGVLGVPGRAAPEVRADGGGEPPAPAAAAGAARRAVRSQRQGPGREPEHLQHRAGARADEGPRSDAAHAGAGDRRRRGADARDGQPPPPRAELPADRAHRERDARAVVRRGGAQTELPGHHLSARADAEVPGERDGRAPVRLRRRGHRSAADDAPSTRGSSRARWSATPASRRRSTSC